jgi:hypothetical protein
MYCLNIAIFLILGQICFSKSVSIEENNLPVGCQPTWYNKCHSDEECCSGNCDDNNGKWKDGVCKPKGNEREQETMPSDHLKDKYLSEELNRDVNEDKIKGKAEDKSI